MPDLFGETRPVRYRCLTLWQPWASLLVCGEKRIETRSWPFRFRGVLLVHAARRWTAELDHLTRSEPFASTLARHGFTGPVQVPPLGAIIGRVKVAACYPTEMVQVCDGPRTAAGPVYADGRLLVSPAEFAFGDYRPGRFATVTAEPVRFAEPVPYRAHQGPFWVPTELVPEVQGCPADGPGSPAPAPSSCSIRTPEERPEAFAGSGP